MWAPWLMGKVVSIQATLRSELAKYTGTSSSSAMRSIFSLFWAAFQSLVPYINTAKLRLSSNILWVARSSTLCQENLFPGLGVGVAPGVGEGVGLGLGLGVGLADGGLGAGCAMFSKALNNSSSLVRSVIKESPRPAKDNATKGTWLLLISFQIQVSWSGLVLRPEVLFRSMP